CRERRTATRAPPAETFNAVANSRNSLPLSSLLRTKTGIASGNLGHCRRSVLEAAGFTRAPAFVVDCGIPHLGGQIKTVRMPIFVTLTTALSRDYSTGVHLRLLTTYAFAVYSPTRPELHVGSATTLTASFCPTVTNS